MTVMLDHESTSRTVESDAGKQHYHEAGTGPVLLLLHGSGPGVTGWANYAANLPVFVEHFRVVILDLPGYGGSDPAEGIPMNAAANAVVAFMDAVGIETAHIIGNSFGGLVGALVAAHHPERVTRFVSIGGVGFGLFGAFPGEGINLLTEFAEDPTRERLATWLRSMVHDQSLITPDLVEERYAQAIEPVTLATTRRLYSRAGVKALAQMIQGPNAAESFAHLARIQAPTLICWGREDRVSTLDRALVPMQLIRNAELHVFPNCGHWTMIEHKTGFERLVLEFLTR
ncbi:MAG TPA: alpha/beta fold hydrolase [Alphaproteobacteria bacterium]|jgi:2-hydroxy-6-oxonona-2,4-dienedioate hydrolase|nr:alpha/beta fold hydrolase [Alphaproteobacteria bacterium]